MPVIATVSLDAAPVQIDGIEIAPFRSRMRRLEEYPAVAQDIGGQMIARCESQPDDIAAAHQRGLHLETSGGPAGVHDAFPGGVKRRDGILAESGQPPRGSPGEGHLPDLPVGAGRLFPCEENAPSVEGDCRVGGRGKSLRERFGLASTDDLNRRPARETIGASRFVMRGLREKKGSGRKRLAGGAQPYQRRRYG